MIVASHSISNQRIQQEPTTTIHVPFFSIIYFMMELKLSSKKHELSIMSTEIIMVLWNYFQTTSIFE